MAFEACLAVQSKWIPNISYYKILFIKCYMCKSNVLILEKLIKKENHLENARIGMFFLNTIKNQRRC